MLGTGAPYRPWRLTPADEPGRDVCMNFVDKPMREAGGVNLAAPFHQKTQNAPPTELVKQWCESHPAIGFGRQLQDLGCPYSTGAGGGDERVGPDGFGRHASTQLRI